MLLLTVQTIEGNLIAPFIQERTGTLPQALIIVLKATLSTLSAPFGLVLATSSKSTSTMSVGRPEAWLAYAHRPGACHLRLKVADQKAVGAPTTVDGIRLELPLQKRSSGSTHGQPTVKSTLPTNTAPLRLSGREHIRVLATLQRAGIASVTLSASRAGSSPNATRARPN